MFCEIQFLRKEKITRKNQHKKFLKSSVEKITALKYHNSYAI